MENIMDKLNQAISEIANLPNSDKVNIKGKYYTTVDTRVHAFRKHSISPTFKGGIRVVQLPKHA